MLMGFKDIILDNTVVVDDLHSAEGHGQWTAQSANAAVWFVFVGCVVSPTEHLHELAVGEARNFKVGGWPPLPYPGAPEFHFGPNLDFLGDAVASANERLLLSSSH